MSSSLDVAAVEAAVADFQDPENGRKALKSKQIRDIQIDGDSLSLTLALTSWSAPIQDSVRDSLQEKLQAAFPQLQAIEIRSALHERPAMKQGKAGLAVKSVIAVGSGKGGVGKSTVAASLAWGLKRAGCKVGLMDADVYGPSVPHLLGVSEATVAPDGQQQQLKLVDKDGLSVLSIGFLVPKDQAVIWRGPMLHNFLGQTMNGAVWGELDYLIIDMPPGTGDVALSLSQMLPLTGAVVVCTPQDVALLDAVKAVSMFRTLKIPVLGVVENMSGFICPDNGKRYEIFGKGGARETAERMELPFLGDVPIQIPIRENGDAGQIEANFEHPEIAACFDGLCFRLVKQIAEQTAAAPPQMQLPVLG